MPNRWLSIAFCSALFSAALWSQEDTAEQGRFAGTWQAKFNGSVFLTLRLEAGARMSGVLSTGRITVDKDGELTQAEPSPEGKESDIMHARFPAGSLTFEIEDDGEVTKFEMRITAASKAELRFLGQPVKIKPIPLDRV